MGFDLKKYKRQRQTTFTRNRVVDILQENAEKPFVQRILNPESSPILDRGVPGETSTHIMATAGVDGKHIVYPTVVLQPDGNLKELAPGDAVKQALETDNFIEFNKADEALAFSQQYKKAWDPKPHRRDDRH